MILGILIGFVLAGTVFLTWALLRAIALDDHFRSGWRVGWKDCEAHHAAQPGYPGQVIPFHGNPKDLPWEW